MVILHDAIKKFRKGILCFFFKEQKPVSFLKKAKKFRLKENRWVVFSKQWVFVNPDCLSILFVICARSNDLEQVMSLSI